jgi:hypothetical protein
MDNQQSPNTPEESTRRHTIDVDTPTMTPRYDFVLPSYNRDRRASSITTTIPSETIINDGLSSVSVSIPEQTLSSLEIENNKKG